MAQTQSLEERIDRLESAEAIRQLASRYALAVDTRNLDDLVALFVEDVRVGRDSSGREALKECLAVSSAASGPVSTSSATTSSTSRTPTTPVVSSTVTMSAMWAMSG